MPSFYGKMIERVRYHYLPSELAKYPDYSWLTFNIVLYLNGKMPLLPPLWSLKTPWALYFNKVVAHFSKGGFWVLKQFSKPDNNEIAETLFDLLTDAQQTGFFNWFLKKKESFKSSKELTKNWMNELSNIIIKKPSENLITFDHNINHIIKN